MIRHNRRFALTPAGEYFYRHGKELIQELEDFKRETQRQGEDKELQLSIGYLNNYVGSELYETIAPFPLITRKSRFRSLTGPTNPSTRNCVRGRPT